MKKQSEWTLGKQPAISSQWCNLTRSWYWTNLGIADWSEELKTQNLPEFLVWEIKTTVVNLSHLTSVIQMCYVSIFSRVCAKPFRIFLEELVQCHKHALHLLCVSLAVCQRCKTKPTKALPWRVWSWGSEVGRRGGRDRPLLSNVVSAAERDVLGIFCPRRPVQCHT